MEDPYKVLGVERKATEAAIRTAYRKLAKRFHPDVNPGKPEAAERFKTISAAYALLSDTEQRARFDRGEIDASGQQRQPERPFYRDFGDAAGRAKYRGEGAFSPEDLEGLFTHGFGGRFNRGFTARGSDAHYALAVDFLDAANGAVRRLTLPDGGAIDVTIPAGLKDGQVMRLKGRGAPGVGGAPAGDALIEVSVAPHKLFRRAGNDVTIELPVTVQEAVTGAKVQVPTIKGPVSLTIPPNSNTGTKLRLKGRGIAGGDQFVELKIVLPPETEPELAAFLKTWSPRRKFDPRAGIAS
ncbi:MAG: DnaJ domain-containing protein [Proteobacteria bacterium]|nr:DnaJ domain-containing protein [Pseudomonadota bacterium]